MIKPLQEYLKSSQKTHLIFDFDETIVKLVLPWEKAMDRIREQLFLLDPKICEQYRQRKISFSELQNRYVVKFGSKALKVLIDNDLRFENSDLKEYIQNKDLINFIKKIKNHEMLIWSSNTKPTIVRILQELSILHKFTKIVSREDVKLLKPYAEGFSKIYNEDVSKTNYLFIGDSNSDKAAASEVAIDFYLEDYFNVPGKYW